MNLSVHVVALQRDLQLVDEKNEFKIHTWMHHSGLSKHSRIVMSSGHSEHFRKCFKSILCDILKGSRGAHVYISLAKHLLTCVFGLRAGVCLPNLIRVRSGVNVSS